MGGNSELKEREAFSNTCLEALRQKISQAYDGDNCTIAVVGSIARREASLQSDVDWFAIGKGAQGLAQDVQKKIDSALNDAIFDAGFRKPAAGGAFGSGQFESQEDFLRNVGGTKDKNEKLTQRMLFMLEGECLYNHGLFDEIRDALIDVYVKPDLGDHQLARFFLNDLVRYWHTIAVDFEFKVSEGAKPWGVRNLKLTFSRKLLYFSGIVMAAETAQKTRSAKKQALRRLASMSPIDRIKDVCGDEADRIFEWYGIFLERLSDDGFRKMADDQSEIRKDQSEDFRELKNLGQRFSWELERVLQVVYGPHHPIHHALIF